MARWPVNNSLTACTRSPVHFRKSSPSYLSSQLPTSFCIPTKPRPTFHHEDHRLSACSHCCRCIRTDRGALPVCCTSCPFCQRCRLDVDLILASLHLGFSAQDDLPLERLSLPVRRQEVLRLHREVHRRQLQPARGRPYVGSPLTSPESQGLLTLFLVQRRPDSPRRSVPP